jgi:hypothetical protein
VNIKPAIVALILILSGCSHWEYTSPEGARVTVDTFAQSITGLHAEKHGPNDLKVSLDYTSPEAQIIKSAIEAALRTPAP